MERRILFGAAAIAALWVGALALPRPGRPVPLPTAGAGAPALAPLRSVAPEQLTVAARMAGRALGGFSCVTQDGRRLSWSELSGSQPVVLVFEKQGCPCS